MLGTADGCLCRAVHKLTVLDVASKACSILGAVNGAVLDVAVLEVRILCNNLADECTYVPAGSDFRILNSYIDDGASGISL